MADTIEQIKSRLDVVDVVSGYLKLQRSGVNFKARCPFHNEKTPSFYVSPERQVWHCFGCSKGGDMFSFVKEIEGVEFPEALRVLAGKAGVQLESFDPQLRNERMRLLEVCESASKFFEKQLEHSDTGKKALEYLHQRGLTDETIKEFRLGFAPNDWHALTAFLVGQGYDENEVIAAGLAVKKDDSRSTIQDSRSYDRFRSRITFPILDVNGQAVGFSGRIFELETNNSKLETEPAKYINTPQTLIYDKSRILYGLHEAKMDMKKQNRCLLVEGNMDAIMSYQGGARHVVATSGTALTQSQLRLLQRYTTNLDFCFDADQAGDLATRRGIGLAIAQNFSVRVVELNDPECKDPADYVAKHGQKWAELAVNSRPLIEFYFDKARRMLDLSSVEGKKSLLSMVAPFMKRLTSRVERAHWVGQLAGILRAQEEAVDADLAAVRDDLDVYTYEASLTPQAVQSNKTDLKSVPVDVLSEALLSVVLKRPELFRAQLAQLDFGLIDAEVAQVLAKLARADQQTDVGALMKELREETGSYRYEFAYLKSQELWNDFSDAELQNEFRVLAAKIRAKAITAHLAALQFDIREAEQAKNAQRLEELAAQFSKFTKELAEIQNSSAA